jgi:DNA-binding beta-propeller fold protein YncE
MNCASNAIQNAGDDHMNKLSRTIKILVFISAVLIVELVFLISFAGAVVKFRYITSLYLDDKGSALKQPEGVACNNESALIVADTGNGRLLRYTFEEGAVRTGTVEIKVNQQAYPIKIEMNSKGEIFTYDRKHRRIIRFSPGGQFKGYFDLTGLPSPSSYVLRSFTLDMNDNVYVLDILSQRVVVLSPEGKYLHQIKFPENYGFFSDVAVDFKGTVLLVDSVRGVVFSAANSAASFTPLTESLKEYVRFPASLATDSRGRIYLVDRNGGSIIILGQDGSFLGRQSGLGWKEGRLNYPSQVCINNRGEIFVADTRNNRVQVFETVE